MFYDYCTLSSFLSISMMQRRCLEGWNIFQKSLVLVNYLSNVLFLGEQPIMARGVNQE